jgi:hypothetical protein
VENLEWGENTIPTPDSPLHIFCHLFFVRRSCVAETMTSADKKRAVHSDYSFLRVIFANSLETRIRCENN